MTAANIYTIKTYSPDRLVGFSPIPAMSMVSYAIGKRFLSMIAGIGFELFRIHHCACEVENYQKKISHDVKVKQQVSNKEEAGIVSSDGYNARGHDQCEIGRRQIGEVLQKCGAE